ncbi:MAG: quinone-dependent dihydroorotate dehydrogenase [Planctomycetota bacterium]
MRIYTTWLRPAFFKLSPEQAHHLAMAGMRAGMAMPSLRRRIQRQLTLQHPMLAQSLWGLPFTTPVGLAAGFDKNAEAVEELAALGFSHIEVGTVTAEGQSGNPRPRCFRLQADQSLINRMGFNNKGATAIAAGLARRYDPVGVGAQRRPGCVLGVNIGQNTGCPPEQSITNHLATLERLGPFADYVVINVSCPNVHGVTALQQADSLRPLLEHMRLRLRQMAPDTPLLVKLGPDLSEAALQASVEVILGTACDGIICTNTTRSRERLRTPAARIAAYGAGGLSGSALRSASTRVLAQVARLVDGRVPLIGVGGIDSAESAWEKICHGASLVQVYSGFIYAGPILSRDICRGLVVRLKRHGLRHLREAVGRDL